MSTIPDNEPASLRCGDTWQWSRTLSDYPAGTWTLKYRFKSAASGFEVVAAASGTDHLATVSAATSGGYTAGRYTWMAWVESGAEKFTVDSGTIELLPDYRSGAATVALDDRSHARKMLDQIETWLESHGDGVAEYEIAGRRMKYDKAGLIKLHNKYQSAVAAEEAAAKLARGEGSGRKIQFRM